MSDITDYPALPVQDRDEREFERKHADAINYLLQRVADLDDRVGGDFGDATDLVSVVAELQPAGYGGGVQNAVISPFSIPTGYITLPFDTLAPAGRGVTFTTATNTFVFDHAGVWTLIINFSIEGFTELNAGRSFFSRIYNVTDGTPGEGIVIGIGRNTQDVSHSTTVLVTITDADVTNGVSFRAEMGGGDAITGGDLK